MEMDVKVEGPTESLDECHGTRLNPRAKSLAFGLLSNVGADGPVNNPQTSRGGIT